MNETSSNGEYRKRFYTLVDESIQRLSDRIIVLGDRVEELRRENVLLQDQISALQKNHLSNQENISRLRDTVHLQHGPLLTKLTVKSGIWGIIGGAIPSTIAIAWVFFKLINAVGGNP